MTATRRQFLKSTAALAPAIAVAAPVAIAAPIIEAVTPVFIRHPFRWYFSYEGETYNEDFDTKEQAIAYLKECGEGMISECQRKEYDLSLEGWRILEQINDDNEEARGESEGIECTNEQERDLGEMVSEAVAAWARKHKIDTTAWTFGTVRNTVKAKEVVAPTDTLTSAHGKKI